MWQPTPDFDHDEEVLSSVVPPQAYSCPPLDVLRAKGMDVLPPDVEVRVAEHLAVCGLCSTLLRDLDETDNLPLSDLEKHRIDQRLGIVPHPSSKTRWRWTSVVAASLLAASIGAASWYEFNHRRELNARATQDHLKITQQPSVQAAALYVPLDPLPPPDFTALQTRGLSSEPATEALLPAFNAYNRKQYDEAAKRFKELQRTYPRSAVVPLYLGVSQTYLGQLGEAIDSLREAQTLSPPLSNTARAAQWYEAVAALRIRPTNASGMLQSICDDKGSKYSEPSCELLRK